MARKRGTSRWADQAALEGLVRFGPQLDVLKQAQRTAQDTYGSSVAQADAGRVGVQQAVDAAAPQMAAVYDRAGLDQARVNDTLLGHDLAGLGGVADSIKAGAALEASGMAGRLGEARAASLGDLTNRRVQAVAGAETAKRSAQDKLISDLEKILQTKQDLVGQRGTFEAATIDKLTGDQRDRSLRTSLNTQDNQQSERNSLRSSGIDPATGKPIPGGKLDPNAPGKKPKHLSLDKHLEYSTKIQEIASFAAKYKGLPRAQIVEKLTRGRPQQTVYADGHGNPVSEADKGKPGVHKVVLPKVPQFAPDVRMRAALDVALDGHLSRQTQRELQKARFRVRDLNLPTYAEWKRANPGAASPKAVSGTQNAARTIQALVGALGG